MRKSVLVLSWLAAAALTSGIAWAALSSADRQVGDTVSAPVLTIASTAPDTTSIKTNAPDATVSTTASTSSTSTTTTSTTSTTSPGSSATASTTTGSGSAPAADEWDQTTVPSPGGVVIVNHRPGEVGLASATPSPGFAMEIDEQGPDEVRVEFEGEDETYEVRVRWQDGALRIEVDD